TAGGRATGVESDDGLLEADAVVVAGGAWSAGLAGLPPLRTRIKPMAGQILRWESRPPRLRRVVYGCQGYVVPRPDGRVLMGSTLEDRGFDKAVTLAGVQRIANMGMALVPGLGEGRFDGAWAGLRPATGDGLPLLGGCAVAGLYFAAGHYRNGILLTPITARVIRDLVMGDPPPVDVTPFHPGL
ncbi:MAG: FAD-dependent oxidoreductase, partial [Magnetococcales bacterium]|nr:FAD-dependent oxidoreductase [Magnetococcales bacterium]